jgi:hypothetical protein
MKTRQTRADGHPKRRGALLAAHARRGVSRRWAVRRTLLLLIICFAIVDCAGAVALAQSSSPTPPAPSAQGSSEPRQQVRHLAEIAVRFVPAVKRTVEGAMLKRYTFLAMVFAQLVLLAAFLKLQAERPGATRDFFAQCGRATIILPLIVLGPWLVSYLYTLGGQLVFPLRVPVRAAVREFNDSYHRFTMGIFTATDRGGIYQPMPTGTAGIVGILSDRESTVKTVDQMMDPAQWDMTKLFTCLNIVRGILSFGEFILVVLTGFLMIAFRLAVPWMIAMSIDRSLAHEVSYKFARGVVVFTLVFPIVAHILMLIAYKIGTLGLSIYDGTPIYNVDPRTAQLIARPDVDPTFCFGVAVFMMGVAALCFIAAPVLSWKIAFGQTFEGVATVASGWMAAIVGSGINFASARIGAALNNTAERLQVETSASAGLTTARADYSAATQINAAGLHNQLGQIGAARAGAIMSNNAAAVREQANLLSVYRNSMANVRVSRDAQVGAIEAERGYSARGAQNAAAREQSQVFLDQQTAENTNDQQWWSWGTETVGGAAGGVVAGGAPGAGLGTSVGRGASRPGEIVTDQVNIDTRMMGGISLSSQYLKRTSESNRTLAEDRTEIEQARATAQEGALTEQYRGQSGAVSVWQRGVNAAANTQAGIASQAARESTSILNDAARVKLAGTESAISQVRAAGLQAAEYHRMAQIISQVTHDMTRRIEEMGQYRF